MVSLGHLIVFGVVVMVLFGSKKVPVFMKMLAKGIKDFKKGLDD